MYWLPPWVRYVLQERIRSSQAGSTISAVCFIFGRSTLAEPISPLLMARFTFSLTALTRFCRNSRPGLEVRSSRFLSPPGLSHLTRPPYCGRHAWPLRASCPPAHRVAGVGRPSPGRSRVGLFPPECRFRFCLSPENSPGGLTTLPPSSNLYYYN